MRVALESVLKPAISKLAMNMSDTIMLLPSVMDSLMTCYRVCMPEDELTRTITIDGAVCSTTTCIIATKSGWKMS